MSSSKDLVGYIDKGIEIAGAAMPPALAAALTLSDPTAGALSQLGVIISKELKDYVSRSMSYREESRSAAVIICAAREIERRMSSGETIRDDDFFRLRTGIEPSANTLFEGVLAKAKQQYEERKINLIGKFFASVTFDARISAEDACWYLTLIDSLNFRSLLILAAFKRLSSGAWSDQNISLISERSPVIFSQINELRNLNLLSPHSTFSVEIQLTPLGSILVESMALSEELEFYGSEVNAVLNPEI
jgi:hypothetical protein